MKNTELINKIGQSITSTLEISKVIELMYESIKEVMDINGLIIYLLNESKNQLESKYILGKHKNIVHENISMDSNGSFCVYTIKNNAELLINDVKKEYVNYLENYYWKDVPDDEIIHSFINIPLVINSKVFGVVSVQSYNRNAYTMESFDLLKSLAVFMSISLNNAEIFNQLNKAKESITLQKKVIEDKNKEITDSIHYAQRIQRALITPEKYIDKQLNKLNKNS